MTQMQKAFERFASIEVGPVAIHWTGGPDSHPLDIHWRRLWNYFRAAWIARAEFDDPSDALDMAKCALPPGFTVDAEHNLHECIEALGKDWRELLQRLAGTTGVEQANAELRAEVERLMRDHESYVETARQVTLDNLDEIRRQTARVEVAVPILRRMFERHRIEWGYCPECHAEYDYDEVDRHTTNCALAAALSQPEAGT